MIVVLPLNVTKNKCTCIIPFMVSCVIFQLLINNLSLFREAEVKKFISGGKNLDALKAALADPPLQTKDEKAKVMTISSPAGNFELARVKILVNC